MAQGYWDRRYWPGCPCCSSGPKCKFICLDCLHVCKAPIGWKPSCPQGHGPMTNMGQRWRPERKHKRAQPQVRVPYVIPAPGVELLEKLNNNKRRVDGNYR